MRALAICALLAGCGPSERSSTRGPAPAAPAVAATAAPSLLPTRPGLRLPDGLAPVSYDLRLELDPASDAFTGHVAIAIAVTAPTTQLWLHAVDLDIARAALVTDGRTEPLALLAGGDQMRGFALPRPVASGTITVAIDYRGHATDLSRARRKEEEGVFRQLTGGRWYLYSQSESIFARKIVPCFDEPRWKPAWRVTLVVPGALVALGNGATAGERVLRDGRREVRLVEIAAMQSYLLAVAVGPFDVVAVGRLGRGHLPVRLAVPAGDFKRTDAAMRTLPKVVDALETYLDAPLPLAKLDIVAVPQFFGAMENTGLITFDRAMLLDGYNLVSLAAHELAHQWFGNAVTPAWWDHLWLSEAFATWLAARVSESLEEVPSPVLAHVVRGLAVRADDEVDAKPLVHAITSTDDIEPAFDGIAYDKGAAVLATFERFVGPATFRTAVRGYLAAHAGASVTSQAFVDALAAATRPELGAAFASNLAHAGMPVVELSLRCGSHPAIVATARDGVIVPVCARFPVTGTATDRACFLAGAHTEQPLAAGAGCPPWLVGNAGGRGYYQTAWRGPAPHPPLALLSPEERLTRGEDASTAFRRGELAIGDALAEITQLTATHDPYGELAAVRLAFAVDPIVDDAARPAWAAWLTARFADRLTRGALGTPKTLVASVLRTQVVALTHIAVDPVTIAAARQAIDRARDFALEPTVLQLAATRDAGPLFDRIVRAATDAKAGSRDALLAVLGKLPADFAPRVVELAVDPRFSGAQLWPALDTMLGHGPTRTAAWRAIHARFAALIATLPPPTARRALDATAALCDAARRDEVIADFTPWLAGIPDARRALDHAVASIDRCIALRAAAGDIAGALARTPLTPRG